MKSTKILVTGGAGFIGSHLTDHLLELGHKVIVLDNLVNGKEENLSQAKSRPEFVFVNGDLLDSKTCEKVTKDVEVVYHLACLGVRHSLHSPFENHRVNAEGTLTLLEACRKNRVSRFFYISTSEIYGDVQEFPITENAVPLPKTVYGSSKLAGENYAYSYNKCFDLDVTILRIFNNYGPRAHYEGDAGEVIPRTIVSLLYGESPVIFGDGGVTRDFFFVRDTAHVLASLLDHKNISGAIFNIGTGKEITMKALVEKIVALMKSPVQIEYLEDRPADVPRLWVDPGKFTSLTGFRSTTTLDAGLLETVAYYKNLASSRTLINEVVTRNWEK